MQYKGEIWSTFDYERLNWPEDKYEHDCIILGGRRSMSLSFEKTKEGDSYWYTMYYGYPFMNNTTDGTRLYCFWGSYLWEEEMGTLQGFIDKIINEAKYIERF